MPVPLGVPSYQCHNGPLKFGGAYLVCVRRGNDHIPPSQGFGMFENVKSRAVFDESRQAAQMRTPGYDVRTDRFVLRKTAFWSRHGDSSIPYIASDIEAILVTTNSKPNPVAVMPCRSPECGPEGDAGLEDEMNKRGLTFYKLG